MGGRIRVLVTDDSAVARSLLRGYYEEDGDFDVVGEASNGREAVAMTRSLRPSLVTMDLNMPVMGGLEAIEEIMSSHAVPILVVSCVADAQNAYAAVARGAVEVVHKPGLAPDEIAGFLAKSKLVAKVPVVTHLRSLQVASAAPPPPRGSDADADALPAGSGGPVFAIAASTGGPQALASILAALPAGFPCPILIAQHISDGFAAGMAEWLATLCRLPVRLAQMGQPVAAGVVLIAPSEAHMAVTPAGIVLRDRNKDLYRPSCDILLGSVAALYGKRAAGIILTGMGSDGARGLEQIRQAGGATIAQDEASSIIFGMNRVAIERGAARRILPLDRIAPAMVEMALGQPASARNGR